jgi:RNA polymerase sigma-70 factor (ECF subfamily)
MADLIPLPSEAAELPDQRLALLFVCAHPAIDPAARTPLMLQTVLGLDAARIAAAFLVPPATMSQRLVRAKTRIRDTGLRFSLPVREDLAPRLSAVLDAIYAAFGRGCDDLTGGPDDLTTEAIYLARLLHALLPQEPEAAGLLALMLYTQARRPARRDARGRFVPLSAQDSRLWSRDLIIEAECLLTTAARHASFGRYQCEAAIQSVHIQRPITGHTNNAVLLTLYDLLIQHSPGLGAQISRAVVLAEAGQPDAALTALNDLPADRVAGYQPYWIARAKVLGLLSRPTEARAARDTAITLTDDPAIRAYLVSL